MAAYGGTVSLARSCVALGGGEPATATTETAAAAGALGTAQHRAFMLARGVQESMSDSGLATNDGSERRAQVRGGGSRRGAESMSVFSFELIMLLILGISLPVVYWRKIRIRHL